MIIVEIEYEGILTVLQYLCIHKCSYKDKKLTNILVYSVSVQEHWDTITMK